MLSLNCSYDHVDEGHECSACGYLLDEESAEIFDNLEKMEESIPLATKMSLVYIAGYITRNNPELSEMDMLIQTTFYHQKYGNYLNSLDRGQLNIPSDCACQWTLFCYIIFNSVKDKVCRMSLCNIFMAITEFFHSFNMQKHHGRILSNVLLNNFCSSVTPLSNKEPSLKTIKLAK